VSSENRLRRATISGEGSAAKTETPDGDRDSARAIEASAAMVASFKVSKIATSRSGYWLTSRAVILSWTLKISGRGPVSNNTKRYSMSHSLGCAFLPTSASTLPSIVPESPAAGADMPHRKIYEN